jgi:hypothetical protein
MKSVTLTLLIVVSAVSLTGCAPPLASSEIMPKTSIYSQLGKSKYDKKLTLGDVNVLVSPDDRVNIAVSTFQGALLNSIAQAGLLATKNPKYRLDATLIDLDQPFFGFNYTVKSSARYVITDIKSNTALYDETLTLPCSVRFADAIDGNVRFYKATTCSVSENITHFLKTISN